MYAFFDVCIPPTFSLFKCTYGDICMYSLIYAFHLLLVYLNVPMVTYRKAKELTNISLLTNKWEICCSNPSTKTRDQS